MGGSVAVVLGCNELLLAAKAGFVTAADEESASFLGISRALHLDLFDRPAQQPFFNRLLGLDFGETDM
jgi:hypothetical protein